MLGATIKSELMQQDDIYMVINRAELPKPESVQARMTFGNNIRVLGAVLTLLTLQIRSSWELPTLVQPPPLPYQPPSGITLFNIIRCCTLCQGQK